SSASVASVFGLGGGMSLVPSLRFLGSMLLQYEFLICAILASAFALWCLTHGTRSIIGLAIVALSSVIPFLIVALSNFKLERYAYPGFIGMFVLAGCGLSLVWTRYRWLAGMTTCVLLALPITKVAVTNALLPTEVLNQGFALQSRVPL